MFSWKFYQFGQNSQKQVVYLEILPFEAKILKIGCLPGKFLILEKISKIGCLDGIFLIVGKNPKIGVSGNLPILGKNHENRQVSWKISHFGQK